MLLFGVHGIKQTSKVGRLKLFQSSQVSGRSKMIRRTFALAGSTFLCLWVSVAAAGGQKGAKAGDPAKGKEVFEQCAMCHNVDSPEKKMGPSLQGLFKRKTLQNGKPVNDGTVTAQINEGGNGMPAYSDTLSADDKKNVLAYLHTL
jgi:cytochrome c